MRNKIIALTAFMALVNSAVAQDLIITGVIDGPLSGGLPKAVEVYVVSNVADLSIYGVGGANNGGGSDGEEFTFPAGPATAGDFIYVASESTAFNIFFGFAPDHTSFAVNINGDDAIELFQNGGVVDVFGDINVDGTGQPWDHLDGWTYRNSGTGPDGTTFVLGNWSFSGTNALDGETTNASAATPFPIGSYSLMGGGRSILINEVDADTPGTDSLDFVELYDGGDGNTALDGLVVVFYNGSDDQSNGSSFDLDGFSTDADGYFVLGHAGVTPTPSIIFSASRLQNGADAVALHLGNAADFPNDTPVTTDGLVDALVYDTNDSDDAGLLPLLNAGQPQVNEGGSGDKDNHSNQRCPNGSGGARNTVSYAQFLPTPGAFNICVAPAKMLKIHEVQGSGTSSPEVGNKVAIDGIVVGDFQDGGFGTNGDLNGFFVQEEDVDVDGDPATSEGIFIFNGFSPTLDVAVGDLVHVEGNVSEFFGLTQITSFNDVTILSSGNTLPTAATVSLPVADVGDFEHWEGMLTTFPDTLYVSGNFNQGRFGEVDLSVGAPLDNPTNVVAPGGPALALSDLNNRSRIQLDDGSNVQNPLPLPPYIGIGGTLRTGDTVEDLTAVLSYAFGVYELHPVAPVSFTRVNTRLTPPSVGGAVRVASFNVLNYFTTLDNSGDICGPAGDDGCRGADNALEFMQQRDKLVTAITTLDAHVVGVIEIENSPADIPIGDLVDGLNDMTSLGTYAFVATGPIGTDAIRVGLIYQPASVTPFNAFEVLGRCWPRASRKIRVGQCSPSPSTI